MCNLTVRVSGYNEVHYFTFSLPLIPGGSGMGWGFWHFLKKKNNNKQTNKNQIPYPQDNIFGQKYKIPHP